MSQYMCKQEPGAHTSPHILAQPEKSAAFWFCFVTDELMILGFSENPSLGFSTCKLEVAVGLPHSLGCLEEGDE